MLVKLVSAPWHDSELISTSELDIADGADVVQEEEGSGGCLIHEVVVSEAFVIVSIGFLERIEVSACDLRSFIRVQPLQRLQSSDRGRLSKLHCRVPRSISE